MPDPGKYQVGKIHQGRACVRSACKRKWHIFYLRPRAENLVHRMLTNLNYEVFWPVIQSVRTWKNRQKRMIRLSLFPNYLFVYSCAHELYAIKCLPHVVACVSCGGEPSSVSEKEIEGIRRVLGLGRAVSVESRFSKGELVRIVSGPLEGYEGILVKQYSHTRFGIQLKAINHTLLVDINRSELKKI